MGAIAPAETVPDEKDGLAPEVTGEEPIPLIPDIPPEEEDVAAGVAGDAGIRVELPPDKLAPGAEKRLMANCSNCFSKTILDAVFLYCSLRLQSWYH